MPGQPTGGCGAPPPAIEVGGGGKEPTERGIVLKEIIKIKNIPLNKTSFYTHLLHASCTDSGVPIGRSRGNGGNPPKGDAPNGLP